MLLHSEKAYHNSESIKAEITYPEKTRFINAHRTPLKNKLVLDIHKEDPNQYDEESGFFTGLIYGLPVSISLWAIIWSSIGLLF